MFSCLPSRLPFALACTALPLAAAAQPHAQAAMQAAAWQACAAIGAAADRLACFDRWAENQRAPTSTPAAASPDGGSTAPSAASRPESTPAPATAGRPETTTTPAPAGTPEAASGPTTASGRERAAAANAPPPAVITGPWRNLQLTALQGCRNTNYSELSRFWELEPGTDCGTFGLRGYRPITMAVATADTVNRQPTSGNPLNNVPTATNYRTTETRLQLSVRTKLAQGLLSRLFPDGSDSLWLAYTQQSYWQIFTPQLSRPFRSTDHEPEILYVMPLQSAKEGEWRLRYAGIAAVHQSNGQSLPWSRSWNRAYLMAGAEKGPFQLHARAWRRTEAEEQDDNPGITSFIGRAELRGSWQANRNNLFAATLRHSLRKTDRGSARVEWFRTLGNDEAANGGGLQLHTQVFSGYGDTLLDYNRRRTVFSVGLSLVDW